MKKSLLFFASLLLLFSAFSCTKPEPESPDERIEEKNQPITQATSKDEGGKQPKLFKISDLWQIKMRREIPYPFKVYILQLEDGNWFYLRRLNFEGELHIGDEINFSFYNNVPNEIAQIHYIKCNGGASAKENAHKAAIGTYLVATDPIEADVKNMFVLKMRYALPFTPIETVVIETTDGNLIHVKASKLPETNSQDLKIGDHFVYNVYTIFPNEVVAIKKL